MPIREISCPLKNSWKLRCRKARPAAFQRGVIFAAGGAETADAELADSGALDDIRNLAYNYNGSHCTVSQPIRPFSLALGRGFSTGGTGEELGAGQNLRPSARE